MTSTPTATGPANRHLIMAVSCLFILSSGLFAVYFRPAGAIPLLLGCLGVGWTAFNDDARKPDGFLARPIDWRLLGIAVLAALILFVIGGEGHFFYANADWLARDAVLADLTRSGPLATYQYEGRDYVLRAPLGMYMIPGLVGWLAGLKAAHFALLAQNTAMTGSVLYIMGSLSRARPLVVIALFIFFGGLNVVPWIVSIVEGRMHGMSVEMPIYMENWSPYFTYSSHVVQMFYVPNHMTPGWWLAALALLRARDEISLGLMGALVAPMMFWSPLAVAVAPILLIYFAARAPWREVFCRHNWIAGFSAALFIPVVIYLLGAAETIPSAWTIAQGGFALAYLAFIAVEIPHAVVVLAGWSLVERRDRGLFLLCLVMLLAIPAYSFGPFNDFAMRASIPALAVLAFLFANVFVGLDPVARPILRLVAMAIIGLGCYSPIILISGGFTRARFAISDCNFLSTWYEIDHATFSTNYLAPLDRSPAWLIRVDPARPPLQVEKRSCWPDHPEPDQIHHAPG